MSLFCYRPFLSPFAFSPFWIWALVQSPQVVDLGSAYLAGCSYSVGFLLLFTVVGEPIDLGLWPGSQDFLINEQFC